MLITGANGQIGQQLVPYLQSLYGPNSVIATDLRQFHFNSKHQPEYFQLDITVLST